MKYSLFFLLGFCIFPSCLVLGQQFQAQVLDSVSGEPVPYANVRYDQNKGVVTNEEGFFSIVPENEAFLTLEISSMGYESLQVTSDQLTNSYKIFLRPRTTELPEVFLSDQQLSGPEILEKIKNNIDSNYRFGLSKRRVFLRETTRNLIRKFNLEVEESTIAGINQELLDRIIEKSPKESASYREVLADLYGDYQNQKVQVLKAAHLHNPYSSQNLEQLTEHLETLFKRSLKKNSYLKIRSGIVGVKIDAEELEEGLAESHNTTKEKTAAQKEKEKQEAKESLQKDMQSSAESLLSSVFWKEGIPLDLFEHSNRYQIDLEGYDHIDGASVFVLKFTPKRRADFRGRLYVNTTDYGVYRLEYENVRPLKKFRLFGIRTSKDVLRGKMIFIKGPDGRYALSYLEEEKGESVGIDRPLTIIEKNKTVPGRRKQNELDMDLDLYMSQLNKLQLVVYDSHTVSTADVDTLRIGSEFQLETFKTYQPAFWNGYHILEPNEAIRQFSVLDQEEVLP